MKLARELGKWDNKIRPDTITHRYKNRNCISYIELGFMFTLYCREINVKNCYAIITEFVVSVGNLYCIFCIFVSLLHIIVNTHFLNALYECQSKSLARIDRAAVLHNRFSTYPVFFANLYGQPVMLYLFVKIPPSETNKLMLSSFYGLGSFKVKDT